METANNQVSPADIQRAKDNDAMATKIQANADKRKDTDSQEPILVTEATRPILERQGITNVITQEELDKREKDTNTDTVVNTVKDAISKPAETEQQQVKKTEVNDVSNENVDLTEDEFSALERAGITEEQILASDGTLKQIKELAQTQLKKEQEAKPSQDESSMVISDAYAEQLAITYPFAKSLKGKTMEDVMEILSKQNSYITGLENSKGKVTDTKDIDKNNSQTDNSDEDLSGEEVIDLLNLSPQDATVKLKELMKRSAENVTDEMVTKKIRELFPNLEGLQKVSNEQYETEFYTEVAKGLPEGIDPKKVVEDWKAVNKDMPNESKVSLADNVNLLITTIQDSYNLGRLSKENADIKKNKDGEVNKLTYEKVRELIKKSKELGTHNGTFNFKRKNLVDISGEPQNAGEEMYDKIIKRNLNRL